VASNRNYNSTTIVRHEQPGCRESSGRRGNTSVVKHRRNSGRTLASEGGTESSCLVWCSKHGVRGRRETEDNSVRDGGHNLSQQGNAESRTSCTTRKW
jgi:hypothetical protein